MSELSNRLQKNYRRLAASFRSQNVEAWRLYAQDIPAYPYLIDLYKNYVLLYDQGREVEEDPGIVEKHHGEARAAFAAGDAFVCFGHDLFLSPYFFLPSLRRMTSSE